MIRRETELVTGPTVVELLGDPAGWEPQPHADPDRTWVHGMSPDDPRSAFFAWEQMQFDLER